MAGSLKSVSRLMVGDILTSVALLKLTARIIGVALGALLMALTALPLLDAAIAIRQWPTENAVETR